MTFTLKSKTDFLTFPIVASKYRKSHILTLKIDLLALSEKLDGR